MPTLAERLKQDRFESPQQEAALALLVAGADLRQRLGAVCAEHGLTHDQYNVLRILRGVYPGGHPRYAIAERLIERAPDVTRLVDRLVKAGLAERYCSPEDRRCSFTRITEAGLALLDTMETPIRAARSDFMDALAEEESDTLARLCGRLGAE